MFKEHFRVYWKSFFVHCETDLSNFMKLKPSISTTNLKIRNSNTITPNNLVFTCWGATLGKYLKLSFSVRRLFCFYKSRELYIDHKSTVSGNKSPGLQVKFVGIVGCGCWAPWRMKPVFTITVLHVHPSFDLFPLPILGTQWRRFSILCQQTFLLFQRGCERHHSK